MATWNYRVIDFGTHLALHEVHYDDEGDPRAYTVEPAVFVADPEEAVAGIIRALDMARTDSQKPILTMDDFPEGE